MLARDLEKFNHIVQGANTAIKESNKRYGILEERQVEMGTCFFFLLSLEKTLEDLRKKNDGLREKINQQEFSPEQVEQFRKAYSMWKNKINEITSQKQIASVHIDELVSTIDEHIASIDSMIDKYHELLLALQLLPSSTPFANGVDYRLVLDRVDEIAAVSSRNVQHYQTQITSNTMLTRLKVVAVDVNKRQSVLEEYYKSVEKAINSFREEIVKYDDKRQKKESDLEQKTLMVNNLKERCEQMSIQRDELLKVSAKNNWLCIAVYLLAATIISGL